MTSRQTTVAIRVLRAINEREKPDPADVALLRTYLPDHYSDEPDELACAVILATLELRKKVDCGIPENQQQPSCNKLGVANVDS